MVNISSLLVAIMDELRKVQAETYYDMNPRENDAVIYPYATVTTSSSKLNPDQDGFNVDIMLHDRSNGLRTIADFESAVINHIQKLRLFKDDIYMQFRYLRSTSVPSTNNKLKRRNVQIYVKVDWRR